MKRIGRFDAALTGIMAVAALAVAAASVKVAFFPGATTVTRESPELLPEAAWRESMTSAIPINSAPNAPITVMVFADLECPACKAFHDTLKEVVAARPGEIAVVHMHHVLQYHRFARPAALALECATRVDAQAAWLDVIYAKQDSLGLKRWEAYAHDAGIADSTFIRACATEEVEVSPDRIEAGARWAREFEIRGTPGVVVNGWRLPNVPSISELVTLVDTLLSGGTLES